MAKELFLSIVSPEKVLFEGPVNYFSVPGSAGYMGVLVDHTPLVASLKPGTFDIRPVGKPAFVFETARAGLFEICANNASVLLDSADSSAIAAG